jgi:Cu+-exporting ATPase
VVASNTGANVELDVGGMTCAACQANVRRSLERRAGVRSAAVDLLLGSARVEYDPTAVSPDALVEAVRASGYEASIHVPGRSPAAQEEARERAAEAEFRELRTKAIASGVAAAVAMLASMPLMSHAGHAGDPLMSWLMHAIDPTMRAAAPWLYAVDVRALSFGLLALTSLVLAWAGRHFFVRAWDGFRRHSADMSTLIAVGTGAAFLQSVAATLAPRWFEARGIAPDVYYEAIVTILALVLAGNAIEARARRKTSAALRGLIALQPKVARVVRDSEQVEVPIESLRRGDVLAIRPGERIPVDGEVVGGSSAVDESLVTGESMPVDKAIGARVIGGSLNTHGALRVRATTLGADSVLARIVELLRAAQGSRAPMQRLADRISGVFVPVVISIAIATFVAWYVIAGDARVPHGLAAAVSVLIIACPCAMGLAIPTAVMVASGRGAKAGLLIKGGEALERAGRVTTVVLDKTGTLTEGRPSVTDVALASGARVDGRELLRLVASLESASEHPLAAAIVRSARERGLELGEVDGFRALTGRGAVGRVGAVEVLVGNEALFAERGIDASLARADVERLAAAGKTAMLAALDGSLAGVIATADRLAEGSREAVDTLRRAGLQVVMLTGDDARTARAIAQEVDVSRVVAGVLPEGKVEEIRRLQGAGEVVAMVGDGLNDAPALARADVGIAIGAGVEVAVHASDITLMRSDLRGVARAIALSRAATRTMRTNLFWAFAYNAISIPIAAGALYPAFGVLLSPILASAAMAMSSISVLANSLRLARTRLA